MPDKYSGIGSGFKGSEPIKVEIFAGIPRTFVVVNHLIESRIGQRVHINHAILVDNVVSRPQNRLETDATRNPVEPGTLDTKHFGFLH